MNDDWKGCGNKLLKLILRYWPNICLERPRKVTRNLSEDSDLLVKIQT